MCFKSSLFIFVFLASIGSAMAEEKDEEMEPAKRESVYQFVCVPGSSAGKDIPADELELERQNRLEFLAFLAEPAAVIAEHEKVLNDQGASILEKLGAIVAVSLKCSIVDSLKEDISKRGCMDLKGRSYSAAKAVEECLAFGARHIQPEPEKE